MSRRCTRIAAPDGKLVVSVIPPTLDPLVAGDNCFFTVPREEFGLAKEGANFGRVGTFSFLVVGSFAVTIWEEVRVVAGVVVDEVGVGVHEKV